MTAAEFWHGHPSDRAKVWLAQNQSSGLKLVFPSITAWLRKTPVSRLSWATLGLEGGIILLDASVL